MKVCEICGRRLELAKFSRNRRVCRKCRAEGQRERRREARGVRAEMMDDESRERFLAWQARQLEWWEAENDRRREFGQPALPKPDVEPGWLDRLRERAAVKLSPVSRENGRKRA